MVWVAAAVIVSVLVGLFSERSRPEAAADLARRALSFLLYVFFPPIVFVNLAETDFGFGMGAGLLAGLVAILLVAVVAIAVLAAAASIFFGIVPDPLYDFASQAAAAVGLSSG